MSPLLILGVCAVMVTDGDDPLPFGSTAGLQPNKATAVKTSASVVAERWRGRIRRRVRIGITLSLWRIPRSGQGNRHYLDSARAVANAHGRGPVDNDL